MPAINNHLLECPSVALCNFNKRMSRDYCYDETGFYWSWSNDASNIHNKYNNENGDTKAVIGKQEKKVIGNNICNTSIVTLVAIIIVLVNNTMHYRMDSTKNNNGNNNDNVIIKNITFNLALNSASPGWWISFPFSLGGSFYQRHTEDSVVWKRGLTSFPKGALPSEFLLPFPFLFSCMLLSVPKVSCLWYICYTWTWLTPERNELIRGNYFF